MELLKLVNNFKPKIICKYGCLYRKDSDEDSHACCYECNRVDTCDSRCTKDKLEITNRTCDYKL